MPLLQHGQGFESLGFQSTQTQLFWDNHLTSDCANVRMHFCLLDQKKGSSQRDCSQKNLSLLEISRFLIFRYPTKQNNQFLKELKKQYKSTLNMQIKKSSFLKEIYRFNEPYQIRVIYRVIYNENIKQDRHRPAQHKNN